MNFGDDALEFRVFFWIHVRRILDRLRPQSAVRFRRCREPAAREISSSTPSSG